jgi:cysteine desulfurase/selenocysteine lyase
MSSTDTQQGKIVDLRNLNPYKLRKHFPILNNSKANQNGSQDRFIYFDNAATTQKPQQVIDTLVEFYQNYNANVHRALYSVAEQAATAYEDSRIKVAGFINAKKAKEIVFTRGATEAINLIANAWGRKFIKEGDEILLSEMEHHSNLIPWQILAKEKGATLRFIPFTDYGTLDYEVKSLINDRTQLIALTHMSNVFGTINPVKGLIRRAHKCNIPVLLDAAQSVPHIPVDVQDLDCDFLVFSGHKMCGPTGIGVLYAKEYYLNKMNPYQGGGDMINSVWLEKAVWNEVPYKFEAGTPNIAGAIGLGSAIDYLNDIGMEKITRYEQAILSYAYLRMGRIPDLKIYGQAPERGSIISFNIDKIHPHDLAQFLDNEGIAIRAGHHCAQPITRKLNVPATARMSLYFYNTFEEVDNFIESLLKAKEFFS